MIRPLIVAEPEGILEGLSRPSAAPPERTRIIANPYDDSRIGVFAISSRACAALSFTSRPLRDLWEVRLWVEISLALSELRYTKVAGGTSCSIAFH